MDVRHALLAAVLLAGGTTAGAQENRPFILQNRFLTLGFDRHTGAWVSFQDRHTGNELVVSPAAGSLLGATVLLPLDAAALAKPIKEGQAVSLTGDWLYTPQPPKEEIAADFLRGHFDGVSWATTPVPSQPDKGDGRLHNRLGDFWYRREFTCPAGWTGKDLSLLIGAVDDFDVTYVNGKRIGQTDQDTPHHWEVPRRYPIPAGTLHQDKSNVLLIRVTNAGFDGGIFGPIVVGLSSVLHLPKEISRPLTASYQADKEGIHILRLGMREGDHEYTLEYHLPDDRPLVWRQATLRNAGSQPFLLEDVIYQLPPLAVGPRQTVSFPGSLPVGDVPLRSLAEGQNLRPRSQEPLAILWDAGSRRGLGTWFHCEDEWAPVMVRRTADAATLRHTQQIHGRLKPGESVVLGTQYVWLEHGSRDATLRGVQGVYRAIGLRAPGDGLKELAGSVMYNGHPGGVPEKGFRGYGGFKALQAYLPTLRRLHVDLLWLLPIWEHGDGQKWNLYSPFDHFQVSPLYGTSAELKSLSAAGIREGVRLMFDLVPHGPPDFTPLAKKHPEWVARDFDGKQVYAWGQYAFDNAHIGWQDYIRRAAEWQAREFGAVGARVDCGAGGPENWNADAGHRPSQSGLYGGLGMNRAIREGFRPIHPGVVVLPEEYTGANIFYRIADLTYDSQLYFLMMDLEARRGAAPGVGPHAAGVPARPGSDPPSGRPQDALDQQPRHGVMGLSEAPASGRLRPAPDARPAGPVRLRGRRTHALPGRRGSGALRRPGRIQRGLS